LETVKIWSETVINSVEKVFFGKRAVVEKIIVALLCRGHVLLEDVPGVGKTILARAISQSLGGEFSRVQCTPDLLPADIIGVSIYNPQNGTFHFRKGPILSNIVLVDEINRATPRTQSALLEAMGENQITVEGKAQALPDPFFLIATENPVEFEGTFPLPEAQKDRFLLALNIGYPDREMEKNILESQRRLTHPVTDIQPVTTPEAVLAHQKTIVNIHVDETVRNYIMDIITGTRNDIHFQLGASPRGSLALYKCSQALAAVKGRDYVIPEDVKEMVLPVLSKRVILKSEFLFKGYTPVKALSVILENVPFPVLNK